MGIEPEKLKELLVCTGKLRGADPATIARMIALFDELAPKPDPSPDPRFARADIAAHHDLKKYLLDMVGPRSTDKFKLGDVDTPDLPAYDARLDRLVAIALERIKSWP